MVSYWSLRALCPAVVLGYVIVAVFATPKETEPDIFPFFDWSLFSNSANPKGDVVLVIREIDGVPLEKPTFFYALPDRFAAARDRNILVRKALIRLLFGLRTGDGDLVNRQRRLIEDNFLGEAKSAKYDIYNIRFDPIERLNTGAVLTSKRLKSFEKLDD